MSLTRVVNVSSSKMRVDMDIKSLKKRLNILVNSLGNIDSSLRRLRKNLACNYR